MKKHLILLAAVAALPLARLSAQQLKVPAPSPLQTTKQAFGLSDVTIEYSRPSVKNRVVFGDLVPFGKVWRTGANQATKITFGDDVKVEGNPVAAGTYAIYTIPNKDSWDIMLYKDLTLGGNVSEYKPENELLKFKVTPSQTANKTETFTIGFSDVTGTSMKVEMLWEQTRVAFNITTDIDARIMKNIDAALEKDTRPYYQAASYYYDNGKDLKQALDWTEKAIAQNPKAYYMVHLKAKILLKMNDKNGAIAAAQQSLALAREQKSDDYVRLNEKLIADANKK